MVDGLHSEHDVVALASQDTEPVKEGERSEKREWRSSSTRVLAPAIRAILLGIATLLACDGGMPTGPDRDIPLWTTEISLRALAQPLTADAERVYVSTRFGIGTLELETGRVLWESNPAPERLVGFSYVVTGEVVTVLGDGELVGLRASTGERLWSRSGAWSGLEASLGGGLYAVDGATLAALDPATGGSRWEAALGPGGSVRLAAGGGRVCVDRRIASDGRVTCWAGASGEALWTRDVPAPSSLAVTQGTVVLMGRAPRNEAGWTGLEAATGEPLWSLPLLEAGEAAISPTGDVLFSCGSRCVAVDADRGTILWTSAVLGAPGRPVVGPRSIFVVDEGALEVLDVRDGSPTGAFAPPSSEPGGFCGTPAVSGDVVVVFTCTGILHAFRTP